MTRSAVFVLVGTVLLAASLFPLAACRSKGDPKPSSSAALAIDAPVDPQFEGCTG